MENQVPFTDRPNHRMKLTITKGVPAAVPVGYCHLHTHPGYLTTKLLKSHDCLKKQCPFLERNHEHPIWNQKKCAKSQKKIGKILKKAYLIDQISRPAYEKLRKQFDNCKTVEDLIRFCDYLTFTRNMDIPETVYSELIPDLDDE